MPTLQKSEETILLEICCESVRDVMQAELGGADRAELCSALYLGGLTPSLGTLLEVKSRTGLDVMTMVRPRQGGFCYNDDDYMAMKRDAQTFLENGADGVVFGILNEDSTIDKDRCAGIVEVVRECKPSAQIVFHRAFDIVPKPTAALEQLIELGFTRVLTSGERDSAVEGSKLIRDLVEQAAGRIEILPGGGLHPGNVAELLRVVWCPWIHAAAFHPETDRSAQGCSIHYGDPHTPPEWEYQAVAARDVARLKEALTKAAGARSHSQ